MEGFDRGGAGRGEELEADLRDAEPRRDFTRELQRFVEVRQSSGDREVIPRRDVSFGFHLTRHPMSPINPCLRSTHVSDQPMSPINPCLRSGSRTRSTRFAAHQASSSRPIRSAARGSANVAVPTPTADATREHHLDRVEATRDTAGADDGYPGERA